MIFELICRNKLNTHFSKLFFREMKKYIQIQILIKYVIDQPWIMHTMLQTRVCDSRRPERPDVKLVPLTIKSTVFPNNGLFYCKFLSGKF